MNRDERALAFATHVLHLIRAPELPGGDCQLKAKVQAAFLEFAAPQPPAGGEPEVLGWMQPQNVARMLGGEISGFMVHDEPSKQICSPVYSNAAYTALAAERDALRKDLESHKRMLLEACVSIGAIGAALGAEMDDDASELEGLAKELRERASCVDDSAHLIRKLVHCRRQLATDDGLAEKAMDYLKRKGLQGSPLRGEE